MKQQEEIPHITQELILFYRKWIFVLEFPLVVLIIYTAQNPLYTFYSWLGSFFIGISVGVIMMKKGRKPGIYVASIRSLFMFLMVWFAGKDGITWMFFLQPIVSTALTLPDIKLRLKMQIPIAVIVLIEYVFLGDSIIDIMIKTTVYATLIVLNAKVSSVFNLQNNILADRNREITDSIQYARKIQQALLAHENFLNAYLKNYFIIYRPKDIVSGDFYWATEKHGRFYLAVCDSTGHGVPGAFMSLLNISFLNEAISEREIVQPNEILNHVRKRLIENISGEETKDGMEGVLLCFDRNSNEISYSSAYNPPFLFNSNKLQELPSDKIPIGPGEKTNSFTNHVISFTAGDILYLYTDGYPDQFGGPKGKKFKYKQLNEKLSEIGSKPLTEQKNILEKAFTDWKGSLDQVDDVLVIGIQLF